jgi:hypothetical protein
MLVQIAARRFAGQLIEARTIVAEARLSTGDDIEEDDDDDLTEEEHTFEPDDEFDEEDFDDDFDEDFEDDFEEIDLPGENEPAGTGDNGDGEIDEEISDEDL